MDIAGVRIGQPVGAGSADGEIRSRAVAELACGEGWLSAALLERFPSARVLALDGSDVMLKETRAPAVVVATHDMNEEVGKMVALAICQFFSSARSDIEDPPPHGTGLSGLI